MCIQACCQGYVGDKVLVWPPFKQILVLQIQELKVTIIPIDVIYIPILEYCSINILYTKCTVSHVIRRTARLCNKLEKLKISTKTWHINPKDEYQPQVYDQPDVYETSDLPECEQDYTGEGGDSSNAVEVLNISPSDAHARFKGKVSVLMAIWLYPDCPLLKIKKLSLVLMGPVLWCLLGLCKWSGYYMDFMFFIYIK